MSCAGRLAPGRTLKTVHGAPSGPLAASYAPSGFTQRRQCSSGPYPAAPHAR